MGEASSFQQDQERAEEEGMKTWRVREVGEAVAVLPSDRKHNSGSSSASSSSAAKSRSLSPVRGLRRARIFGSCLTESAVRKAAEGGSKLIDYGKTSSKGDAQVIDPEIMKSLLEDFITKWNVERPSAWSGHGERWARTHDPKMAAADWLAQESGINVRKITGYLHGEYAFVGMTHADLLLKSMGLQHLLASGEIEVKKNPRWSWRQYNHWLRGSGIDLTVL
jgi:hypothetical protein